MLLQIDSKQEVKWATVLFPPDIDDIVYRSEAQGKNHSWPESVLKTLLEYYPYAIT